LIACWGDRLATTAKLIALGLSTITSRVVICDRQAIEYQLAELATTETGVIGDQFAR
jgi:hypothetical protein